MERNLVGEVFGDLMVLGNPIYKKQGKYKKRFELCKCMCGVEKYVKRDHLLSSSIKNCGCKKRERFSNIGKSRVIHGMEGSTPYKKFMAAKARCNYKNNDSYYRYGGRNIKVEWKDFKEFRDDMKDGYIKHVEEYGEKNTTLDRINNDGNYCKENCRWATREIQYNNMSSNHSVEYKGIKYKSISIICKELYLNYGLVRDRLRNGRSIEHAIETPLYGKRGK